MILDIYGSVVTIDKSTAYLNTSAVFPEQTNKIKEQTMSKTIFEVTKEKVENGFIVTCGYGDSFSDTSGVFMQEDIYIAKTEREADKIKERFVSKIRR